MIDHRFKLSRPIATAAIAVAIASCTLLGSRDIEQCDTAADCVGAKVTASSPGVAAICVDHLCAAPGAEAGAPATEGGADAIADAPPDTSKGCVLRRDCTTPGDLCVDGTCVPLVDAPGGVCQVLNTASTPAYLEEGAPIIGIYTFAPGSSLPALKAADKALQEINIDLPKERRITAVFCNKRERIGLTSAQAAIDFLAKRKIPLVLGQFEASELGAIDPKGLAVWSTLGNLPGLQQAAADGGAPSDAGVVPYRFLVDEIQTLAPAFEGALDEAAKRADKIRAINPPESIKIAIVRNEQTETGLLADRLVDEIALLQAGSSVRVVVSQIASAFDAPGAPDNSTLINELKGGNPPATQPDVIIALGGDEITGLMRELEGLGGWPAASPRPVWVVGTRAKFAVGVFGDLPLATLVNLRTRFIGVDFSGDRANHDAYRLKLPAVQHAGSFDHVYDAVYAAAFASERAHFGRSAGAGPISGADLTRAFDDVFLPLGSAGADLTGAGEFVKGVTAIETGLTISFKGATGPFLFSTDGGRTRRMGAPSYFCFKRTVGGNGLPGNAELSYYVDGTQLADVNFCLHLP